METGDCMVKINKSCIHTKHFSVSDLLQILHSQLSLTKDGKYLPISWKMSHFCSEKKKLIEPKKIAETFTLCEKEIAKLYAATSSRVNTSLYLEFN